MKKHNKNSIIIMIALVVAVIILAVLVSRQDSLFTIASTEKLPQTPISITVDGVTFTGTAPIGELTGEYDVQNAKGEELPNGYNTIYEIISDAQFNIQGRLCINNDFSLDNYQKIEIAVSYLASAPSSDAISSVKFDSPTGQIAKAAHERPSTISGATVYTFNQMLNGKYSVAGSDGSSAIVTANDPICFSTYSKGDGNGLLKQSLLINSVATIPLPSTETPPDGTVEDETPVDDTTPPNEKKSWYLRLWDWIKSLF